MGDDNGEETILDEITHGGLPSNVTADVVAERRTCRECDWLAGDPARDDGSCLDYCVRHCPHQGRHEGRVRGVGPEPIGVIVTPPAVCGQNYVAGGRVFPERCSLPTGHEPISHTANHFCFGIGWWA